MRLHICTIVAPASWLKISEGERKSEIKCPLLPCTTYLVSSMLLPPNLVCTVRILVTAIATSPNTFQVATTLRRLRFRWSVQGWKHTEAGLQGHDTVFTGEETFVDKWWVLRLWWWLITWSIAALQEQGEENHILSKLLTFHQFSRTKCNRYQKLSLLLSEQLQNLRKRNSSYLWHNPSLSGQFSAFLS